VTTPVGADVDTEPGVRFEISALAHEAASMDGGIAIAVNLFVHRQLQNGIPVAPIQNLHQRLRLFPDLTQGDATFTDLDQVTGLEPRVC
jgi:hypothetical protein